MRCFYINLETQPERRLFVERNFSIHAPKWELERIAAVGKQYIHEHAIAGRLRDGEKGCLLSHINAIRESTKYDGHVLIAEDDVMLGPNSCRVMESALQAFGPTEWDILFTDVCVPEKLSMIELFQLRKNLFANSQIKFLPLKSLVFAGSTAYILHERAKEKILGMLCALRQLDIPYDLLLRQWIRNSRLNGNVIFPFATTLSQYAESSLIQLTETQATDAAWNAFRRLTWFDAEHCPDDPLEGVKRIPPSYYDPMTDGFTQILRVLFASNFKTK